MINNIVFQEYNILISSFLKFHSSEKYFQVKKMTNVFQEYNILISSFLKFHSSEKYFQVKKMTNVLFFSF